MKTFYKEVDTSNKDEMIKFLENHFRYNTMNNWNRSTSYANCVKITHLDLDSDIEDKLFELMECDSFYDDINFLLEDFAREYDYRWQVYFNGRSSGYLVLYQGGSKDSGYKSFCMECGQRNYKSTAESGTKCGRCGKDARIDYCRPLMQPFTYPGKSVDMNEDFSEWSMEELRGRVQLVQNFDRLCDDVVASGVHMAENYSVEEEVIMVPKTVKVMKELA